MATHYRVLYPFSAEARGELTVAANVRANDGHHTGGEDSESEVLASACETNRR